MRITDRIVSVPLDWSKPEGMAIGVFVREVVDPTRVSDDLPLLVFLQGGPGGKSPRPTTGSPPWLAEAIKTHRVVLPDQRGTGRSSRIETATMVQFPSGEAAADYLAHFRADSIVDDFEHVRKTLYGGKRWQSLGQSFGGFLTLTYLSRYPEALSASYIAGGLGSLAPSADEVYRRTFPRAAAKTARYYKRFPDDVARFGILADHLADNDVRLPDGDRLSVKRLQTVGIDLGMAPGQQNIHWLVDEAFSAPGKLSDHFLASAMALTSYDGNPLFAALQESIYGHGAGATNWAAEREFKRHPEFAETARPLAFFGEMIFPWMFEEIRSLRPFAAGVNALARRGHHSTLYDAARLAETAVPVAAIVYHDDLYVDAGLSLATAGQVGNLEHWVTNEFEHDGIRQSGNVFKRLVEMVKERGGPLR
jgi:proline iminopeptidase